MSPPRPNRSTLPASTTQPADPDRSAPSFRPETPAMTRPAIPETPSLPSPSAKLPDEAAGLQAGWPADQALALALTPIHPPAAAGSRLSERLMARVARSAEANRPMQTLRREDRRWQARAPGVRSCRQHADEQACTSLVEVAPGAGWPGQGCGAWAALHGDPAAATAGDAAHELLVLAGELILDDGSALGPQDYRFMPRAAGASACAATDTAPAALAWRSGPEGARLLLRSSLPGRSEFAESPDGFVQRAAEAGWAPLRRGVDIRPLQTAGGRISMLVRVAAGARVPAHGHDRGEECLMVQGELFLGDVLLREDEYQFAPAGTAHGELASDAGCVLFFCGAIDPDLVEPGLAEAAAGD